MGDWVVAPAALDEVCDRVAAQITEAGPLGLDLARLDDRERAVLELIEGVVVDAGRATMGEPDD
ncbi:MAG: hypothetical protein AAGK32_19120, partial [Actinomycetota bacterium]